VTRRELGRIFLLYRRSLGHSCSQSFAINFVSPLIETEAEAAEGVRPLDEERGEEVAADEEGTEGAYILLWAPYSLECPSRSLLSKIQRTVSEIESKGSRGEKPLVARR
jgi:hypothetical protein